MRLFSICRVKWQNVQGCLLILKMTAHYNGADFGKILHSATAGESIVRGDRTADWRDSARLRPAHARRRLRGSVQVRAVGGGL